MMAQQQGGSVNWYRTSTASTVPAQNTDPSSAMDEQQKQSRLSDVPFPNIPLRSLMKRVRLMKSAGKLESLRQLADEPDAGEDKKNIFDDDSEEGELVVGGQTDVLLNGASALNELFNEEIEDESTTGYSYSQASTEDEDAPMLPILVGDEGQGYGSVKQNQAKRKKKRKKKRKPWYRRCQPRSQGILEIVNPVTLAKGILRFLFGSSFTYVSVPCLLAAFLFFYFMGDPEFDFLPGNATASWWFLFGARQAITLEVAIAVEHILVEGLALRTKCFVYMMGPLLTLGLIQARGWPVVAVLWSLLDMLILHGNDAFQRNWLFFTGVRLFSSEKDSAGTIILDSDLYLRFLSAMLLVGSCHAIKRTFLALAFGRRSLVSYKRKLELIVADVFIVTEVAELSKELEVLDTMSAATAVKGKDRSWKGTLKVDFQGTAASALTDSPIRDDSVLPAQDHLADERIPEDLSEDDYEEEGEDEEDEEGEVEDEEDNGDEVIEIQDYSSMQPSHASLKKQAKSISLRPRDGSVTSASSGTGRLKSMLERWEDPESKLRKSESASIGDILNFRKALTYLDSPCVFGDAFGNTTSRDDCIKSAQKVYRRILRCTNTSILQFDVIGLLSMSEDGNVDEVKDFALRRVFNPDKENQLSLFAFVQSCDTVYKRVRFFRAAVKNSSIINNVLEDIVDGVVNFVLFLIVLPMLQVNPYPVLVSVSTLLVSFAFAVGSSASSYIEGVLLIAFRRPYDIGDRILVSPPASPNSRAMSSSWLVEDINVWSTTLRFAATNEVASVKNASIAALRIVNCNRSPNALLTVNVRLDLEKITQESLNDFRKRVEDYLRERPRYFDGLVFFRCIDLKADDGLIIFNLRVRHRRSWQDAPLVLNHQGELMLFCHELTLELGIMYDKFIPTVKVRQVGEEGNDNVIPETMKSAAESVLTEAGAAYSILRRGRDEKA